MLKLTLIYSWFTDAIITGVPNWGLLAGVIGFLILSVLMTIWFVKIGRKNLKTKRASKPVEINFNAVNKVKATSDKKELAKMKKEQKAFLKNAQKEKKKLEKQKLREEKMLEKERKKNGEDDAPSIDASQPFIPKLSSDGAEDAIKLNKTESEGIENIVEVKNVEPDETADGVSTNELTDDRNDQSIADIHNQDRSDPDVQQNSFEEKADALDEFSFPTGGENFYGQTYDQQTSRASAAEPYSSPYQHQFIPNAQQNEPYTPPYQANFETQNAVVDSRNDHTHNANEPINGSFVQEQTVSNNRANENVANFSSTTPPSRQQTFNTQPSQPVSPFNNYFGQNSNSNNANASDSLVSNNISSPASSSVANFNKPQFRQEPEYNVKESSALSSSVNFNPTPVTNPFISQNSRPQPIRPYSPNQMKIYDASSAASFMPPSENTIPQSPYPELQIAKVGMSKYEEEMRRSEMQVGYNPMPMKNPNLVQPNLARNWETYNGVSQPRMYGKAQYRAKPNAEYQNGNGIMIAPDLEDRLNTVEYASQERSRSGKYDPNENRPKLFSNRLREAMHPEWFGPQRNQIENQKLQKEIIALPDEQTFSFKRRKMIEAEQALLDNRNESDVDKKIKQHIVEVKPKDDRAKNKEFLYDDPTKFDRDLQLVNEQVVDPANHAEEGSTWKSLISKFKRKQPIERDIRNSIDLPPLPPADRDEEIIQRMNELEGIYKTKIEREEQEVRILKEKQELEALRKQKEKLRKSEQKQPSILSKLFTSKKKDDSDEIEKYYREQKARSRPVDDYEEEMVQGVRPLSMDKNNRSEQMRQEKYAAPPKSRVQEEAKQKPKVDERPKKVRAEQISINDPFAVKNSDELRNSRSRKQKPDVIYADSYITPVNDELASYGDEYETIIKTATVKKTTVKKSNSKSGAKANSKSNSTKSRTFSYDAPSPKTKSGSKAKNATYYNDDGDEVDFNPYSKKEPNQLVNKSHNGKIMVERSDGKKKVLEVKERTVYENGKKSDYVQVVESEPVKKKKSGKKIISVVEE